MREPTGDEEQEEDGEEEAEAEVEVEVEDEDEAERREGLIAEAEGGIAGGGWRRRGRKGTMHRAAWRQRQICSDHALWAPTT